MSKPSRVTFSPYDMRINNSFPYNLTLFCGVCIAGVVCVTGGMIVCAIGCTIGILGSPFSNSLRRYCEKQIDKLNVSKSDDGYKVTACKKTEFPQIEKVRHAYLDFLFLFYVPSGKIDRMRFLGPINIPISIAKHGTLYALKQNFETTVYIPLLKSVLEEFQNLFITLIETSDEFISILGKCTYMNKTKVDAYQTILETRKILKEHYTLITSKLDNFDVELTQKKSKQFIKETTEFIQLIENIYHLKKDLFWGKIKSFYSGLMYGIMYLQNPKADSLNIYCFLKKLDTQEIIGFESGDCNRSLEFLNFKRRCNWLKPLSSIEIKEYVDARTPIMIKYFEGIKSEYDDGFRKHASPDLDDWLKNIDLVEYNRYKYSLDNMF